MLKKKKLEMITFIIEILLVMLFASTFIACGGSSRQGIFDGDSFKGKMDLMGSIEWIEKNVKNGGNYTIIIGKDESIPPISLSYNNMQVNITLKTSGAEHSVKYQNNLPHLPLISIGSGVTFTLENNVSLIGLPINGKSMISINGGIFIMNGGSIRDNTTSDLGGGVYIEDGIFTMNNGTISGNTANRGGGVFVENGTFSMNNGIISGNNAFGSGVYVRNGKFFKSGSGGIIYGAEAPDGLANNDYAVFQWYIRWDRGVIMQRPLTANENDAINTDTREGLVPG